ncbi:MAG: tRNA epoxyqueuosine(34) reductase QueG [Candidatus Kapabacteria bacterium]|nr:tRNA epoxyqueuosine(34) reductase QueG [Candidatus Kapabacteria bacterium]
MVELKEILKPRAKEIGFDLIGFAKAEPLENEFDNYLYWLEQGFNAKMEYLERNKEKRKDISLILENAKTVIVTATNYNTPFYHNQSLNNSQGKISRYAWGEDYHNVILPKLELLASEISKIYPEAKSKCYVDTGPILEKVWAVKAGLGWQGKNSLILTKKFGSYVFLGLIITSVEIEPDSIIPDHCGKCSSCIESCPTNAIVQPKVIDSNKCISYWTIETKGKADFPENVAKNLKNWVFGCDICQEVCPWNRKEVFTDDVSFFPRQNQTILESDYFNQMSEDEFSIRFKNSPIKRAKLEGIRKNISYIKKSE